MSGKIITRVRERERNAARIRSDRLEQEERSRRWAALSPQTQERIRAMREDTVRVLTMGLENFGKIPTAQRHESDE